MRSIIVFAATAQCLAVLQFYPDNSSFSGSTLSDPCRSALLSALDCDPDLPALPKIQFVSPVFLAAVCTAACATSLSSYRASIQGSCDQSDFLLVDGNHYPPTFPADYYSHYYNVACLADGNTYCAAVDGSYYNASQPFQGSATYAELPQEVVCDPCFLRAGQLQLQSPYAVTPDLERNWSDITSRCAATVYTYTPPSSTFSLPAPYHTSTVNGSSVNVSDCIFGAYSVKPGDTCASISSEESVVLNQLVALNGLDEKCSSISGSTLCLPLKCQLYTVQINDTCSSIGEQFNLTFSQIVGLNFQLDRSCATLPNHVNQSICIGLSDYTLPTPSQFPVTTATIAAPTPTGIPIAPNTDPAECGEWHVVVGGDTCNQLSINYQISLVDFYQLNPMLDADCTNLFLGYSYCVEGYGITFPDTAVNATATGPDSWPSPTDITFNEPQIAPGTTSECSTWWIAVSGVTCADALDGFNITLVELQFWNPTLAPDCDAGLVLDTAVYCVGDGPPVNIAPGTITSGCSTYYTPVSGDSCSSIETAYNLTLSNFIAMNPEIDPSCDNLSLGLAYCVASTNATIGGPPDNVAPGTITAGCTEYYTVASGDSCSTIETLFDLSLTQFISMNPEIDANCFNLALNEAYCVQSSNATIPSNLAPGTITSGCTQYYTVVSGNSCSTIETQFGLTLPQFISMNPEIDANCINLALGEAYCVQSSNSTIPANVAPGTITSGCTQYYTVVSGDSCGGIETKFGLTSTQFIAMNPEIDTDCTTLALAEAYCVQTSNSTSTGPPSNLAAGSLANCTTYHTVESGDDCQSMEIAYSIAESDFFRWNPEVKTDCTNILAEEAYCVGGGGQACGKLYVVQSGDGCGAIAGSAGITQAQLNALNPQIDANCDNIEVGEILCVG